MTNKKTLLISGPLLLAMLSASGCADLNAASFSGKELRPAEIGGNDDLRAGPPPPAAPSSVAIEIYDPDADAKAQKITKIRSNGLMEAAQSYGSQMGYARRSWEISKRLEVYSGELSTAYDFTRVVSKAPQRTGVVVPPVVTRSHDAFIVDASGTEASAADEYLTILRPGKIAPVAPTWRDYLVFTAPVPEEPARSLRPTDLGEREIFETWFSEGWEAGVALADAEFADRMTRLRRDYEGMLQYRRLVAQGMMNRMVLADADFGVTVEGDEMRIGSRTVQVTSAAEFESDPARWRIANVTARDALVVANGQDPLITELLKK